MRGSFTYLQDCPATVEIAIGDARLDLEREPPQQFDLLAIDAFASDAIPVHLMTVEAMGVYLRHLKPSGAIAFDVTNRFFDLPAGRGAVGRRPRPRFGADRGFVTGGVLGWLWPR